MYLCKLSTSNEYILINVTNVMNTKV